MSELEGVHKRLVQDRSQRARKSSAQQAMVALQSSVGNQAVGRMLQRNAVPSAKSTIARTPTAAQPSTKAERWDTFVSADEALIAGKPESYAEYQKGLVPVTSFRGGGFRGHPVLVAKLADVSKELKNDEDRNAVSVNNVLRPLEGYHGLGLAVDFDVAKNPYMIGESREDKQEEAKWVEVYDRISWFFLGRKSVLPQLNNMKSDFVNKGAGQKYDLLQEESEAMKKYFKRTVTILESPEDQGKNQKQQGKKWQERVHDDAPAIAEMLTICGKDINAVCDRLGIARGSSEFESQLKVEKQIDKDYLTIGGKDDLGHWLVPKPKNEDSKKGNKTDSPFAPNSTGGIGNPEGGFLSLPKAFVIAMKNAGFSWGAIDIPGESGDIQHFDLRGSFRAPPR